MIQNPNWLLPLLLSGWEISPLFALVLIRITYECVVRLVAYIQDRRMHFYPLLALSLVIAMLFSSWEVFLYAVQRMPNRLQIGLVTSPVNACIFLCFLILVIVTIIQRSLPLTPSQKRRRRVAVTATSPRMWKERRSRL